MATEPLSRLKEYELVNKQQDVRGWQVLNLDGASLGTVIDFVVDTDAQRVDQLILDSGRRFAVRDVTIGDHHVQLTPASAGAPPVPAQALGQEPGPVPKSADAVRRPVIEQELRVGKREVVRSGVRLHTKHEEQPVDQPVMLQEEHGVVTRRALDLEQLPSAKTPQKS